MESRYPNPDTGKGDSGWKTFEVKPIPGNGKGDSGWKTFEQYIFSKPDTKTQFESPRKNEKVR